jgi:predicted Na+-dependent transporter
MRHFLQRRWFLLTLLAGVTTSLLWPEPLARATDRLHPGIVIGFALGIMAWTMPSHSVMSELKAPWPALWATFVSYVLVPAGGYVLGMLPPERDIGVGLLLSASVPCTLASCVLWTRLAGGNEATALLTVFLCTFTSWFATSFWLYRATGVDVSVTHMMFDLVVILVVPVVVGQGLRSTRPGRRFAERHKTALGVAAQFFILSIVIKAAAGVGRKVHEERSPLLAELWLWSAGLAVGLHLAALYFGRFSSEWFRFDRGRAIAVAFSCSQKTLPISLFLFDRYFKPHFPLAILSLLFFHVGQLVLDTVVAEHWRGTITAARRQ